MRRTCYSAPNICSSLPLQKHPLREVRFAAMPELNRWLPQWRMRPPSCEEVLYHPSQRKDNSDRDSQRKDHDRDREEAQYPQSRQYVGVSQAGCSGDLLPPLPPAEKATARQDSATRERSANAITVLKQKKACWPVR